MIEDIPQEFYAKVAHMVDPGTLAERCTRGSVQPWQRARHLDLIAKAAADAAIKKNGRLLVACPPRHGKSILLAHWFPVWYLAMWPHKRVIVASYGAELARRWGRMIRDTVQAHSNLLFGLKVSEDSSAADRWHTPEGGGLLASGVGGGIIGWGADLLIVDDPLKDAEEALSPIIRQKVWDWWVSTARTRLEPGGTAVVDFQRWHVEDLAGKLMDAERAGGEKWNNITLRAIAEEGDDPLVRKPGQALWPERYDVQDLAALKSTDPEIAAWWQAQYQQHPIESGAGAVNRDWWKWYDDAPKTFELMLSTWDLAMKDLEDSDFTAGLVLGYTQGQVYVLDGVKERLDAPGQLKAIRNMTAKWPQSKGCILIEDKANGPAVIQMLRLELQRDLAAVIPIKADASTGGKQARLMGVTPLIQAGKVVLPKGRRWADELVDDAARYPNTPHDDALDAISQGLGWLQAKVYLHEPPKPEDKRPMDEKLREALWQRIRQESQPEESVSGPPRYRYYR